MKSYTGEAAKVLLRDILAQHKEGKLVFDYEKDDNKDHMVAVGNGSMNKTYDCRELIDHYRDLEGNLIYSVVQHIDKDKGYHTIDIDEYLNGFIP